MSAPSYPDQIWHGFRWTWQRGETRLLDAVDATISSAFRDNGHLPQSSDDYMALIRQHYVSKPGPDMTHSFIGAAGAFATCFGCERERRGLHLHALPQDKLRASQLLDLVEQRASMPALKVAMLRDVISQLTWDHKLTIVSVIFALLGTVVTLTTSFPLGGILLESVRSTFAIAITLSIVYLIVVIVFMICRQYYASRLVWGF